jgi:hypothetical protein
VSDRERVEPNGNHAPECECRNCGYWRKHVGIVTKAVHVEGKREGMEDLRRALLPLRQSTDTAFTSINAVLDAVEDAIHALMEKEAGDGE